MGIGEVFAIAGQSNAQGGGEETGLSWIHAVDDRVNSVDFNNSPAADNKLAIGFSKIDKDSSDIGPFHFVPWCWARLGDLLADSLNVPVLFYGAAHGGTAVIHWQDASQGIITPSILPDDWLKMYLGAPYKALGVTLKYYASLTGLRGILWHQGESDHKTNPNDYQSRLETVIAESREDIECDTLAWMVAKVSYAKGTSANPVNGQQQTIDADANVFNGPNTDELEGYTNRYDLIHLNTAAGLASHASYWFNSMVNNGLSFFENASAIPARDFIDLDFTCTSNTPSNPITLSTNSSYEKFAWSNRDNDAEEAKGFSLGRTLVNTVPAGYQKYNWQYDSTNSITVGLGRYALNVTKATSGVVLFSPVMDLNGLTLPTMPSFLSSASQIRHGDTLTLTGSNCNGLYKWSNGGTTNQLELYPSATASYTVACKTLHCLSSSTVPTQVIVSSCFPNSLNLMGNVLNAQSPFQSQLSISSIQQLANTGKLNYTANQSITLNPGFQANVGAVFRASIENCP